MIGGMTTRAVSDTTILSSIIRLSLLWFENNAFAIPEVDVVRCWAHGWWLLGHPAGGFFEGEGGGGLSRDI